MKEKADIFKALGDETRLTIIDMLSCGEICACKIIEGLNLSQPTISHHMKVLQQVGLVKARKDGRWMHYSINKEKVEEIKEFITYMEKFEENLYCNIK
ncbi:ArsR/SmtB family transcription factor [Tissierella creatinophila]|uniref:Transcriptional repressor SdpR n=1 Tax=Tissierella creatinophila DSM 6911 TaxID=1123403 RepID=A0A1U7M5K5_TISCR|nr:metalloregulator ArsR/SmtB family transcription factor [Tissierella creatinophila]OLS02499.1 transcriptional repressor SdpR [Tissierella creatinophila DSM 6911]